MKRALASLAAALALALALPAGPARAESDRWGSFELAAGTYRPDIDSDFAIVPGPYEQVFGTKRSWMLRAGLSKALFTGFGSLELGLQAGWFRQTGNGLLVSGGSSADPTTLSVIPASLVLTYRADFVAEQWGVPLVPYGRAALERYSWWVTEGSGKTTKDGATNGWSVAGGLCVLLDFFDPTLSRELDHDTGINHTYLYAEVKKSVVDDFGSSSSWNLSDEQLGFSGGLLFAF